MMLYNCRRPQTADATKLVPVESTAPKSGGHGEQHYANNTINN